MKTLITIILLASSWQTYQILGNNLTVHYGDKDSQICFNGTPVMYDGHCTDPKAPTTEYVLNELNNK